MQMFRSESAWFTEHGIKMNRKWKTIYWVKLTCHVPEQEMHDFMEYLQILQNERKYKTWFKATIVFHHKAKTRYAGKMRKAELCFSAGRECMEATPTKAISRRQQKPQTCTWSALGFTPWPLASFHSQQPHPFSTWRKLPLYGSQTHREAHKASRNNSFKQHVGGGDTHSWRNNTRSDLVCRF